MTTFYPFSTTELYISCTELINTVQGVLVVVVKALSESDKRGFINIINTACYNIHGSLTLQEMCAY